MWFDPGAMLTLHTAQYISGRATPGSQIQHYCGLKLVGLGGTVDCAGSLGGCDAHGVCSCTATIGNQDSETTATYQLCPADSDPNLCFPRDNCVM